MALRLVLVAGRRLSCNAWSLCEARKSTTHCVSRNLIPCGCHKLGPPLLTAKLASVFVVTCIKEGVDPQQRSTHSDWLVRCTKITIVSCITANCIVLVRSDFEQNGFLLHSMRIYELAIMYFCKHVNNNHSILSI